MDTNSNIPVQKKVVGVEVLHLDELGYGPQRKHTRREWRKECLENFLAGPEEFLAWQMNLEGLTDKTKTLVRFGLTIRYEDGSINNLLNQFYDLKDSHALDFSGQIFEEDLYLNKYSFKYVTLFSCVTFKGLPDFDDATFNLDSDFQNATFSGNANFSCAIFAGDADFENVIFSGEADFHSARFKKDTFFSGAYFSEIANFSNAIFENYADFKSAIFSFQTIFIDSKFNFFADFENTIFLGEAYFRSVIFDGDADYTGALFRQNADFFKTKFNNQCRFESENGKHTIFEAGVNFENAVIENVGHFEKTKFKGEFPNFLGVDNAKTLLVFSGDEYFNKNDTQGNATDRIAQLKRLAEEQGQADQMLMFNAFELNAKASQPGASSLIKTFTWLYDKVSDYGRSFGRPLLTYLGLISITYILALFSAAINSPQDCKGELWRVFSDWRNNGYSSCISYELPDDKLKLNGYRAALEYTTYRAAGILDFSDNDKQTIAVSKRLFNADVESTWMRFWGIFKAIASAALLFLAALGLRNKYRIK